MIRLDNISRYHIGAQDPNLVLRNVSLTVARNDRVGVFGPQSSGKSTLARIACKIEQPNEGTVVHTGRVSWPFGFSGFLHQDMTGGENVAVLAGLAGAGVDRAIANVAAFTMLGNRIHSKVRTYSPAWKARLAIGCSLAFPADIYVADETIAVGDVDFQRRCLAELRRRLQSSGLLLVSKNRRHLEAVCNRFFALEAGRLVEARSVEHAERIALAAAVEQAA